MKFSDFAECIIMLLSSLGVLLFGFMILSNNIEKLANTKLRKIFNKTTKNPLIGVGIGTGVTAIIQSSGATTVMVVGFVNAGILNLYQATAVIMGANIGTTITAQIVALGNIDIGMYAMVFAVVGIFMHMLCKKRIVKTIGLALGGLGLVFIGLSLMENGMNPLIATEQVANFLKDLVNPFLLLFIGLIITAVLQSSSAVTSIIIVLVSAGSNENPVLVGNAALFLVLGSNIGTCVTALISSMGANTNAKRAAMIHLLFNVFGSIIFFCFLLIYRNFNNDVLVKLFKSPATQIAMFHTLFNLTATILFLPFIKVFVKISEILIKDKKEKTATTYLDNRFLKTPSVALNQVTNETILFASICMEALNKAINGFLIKSNKEEDDIRKLISNADKINDAILKFLLQISALNTNLEDEKYISSLHRILMNLSREAELADNLLKYTEKEIKEDYVFSEIALQGIKSIQEKLNEQYKLIITSFQNKKNENIIKSDVIENEIDALRSSLINGHIKRLEEGKCSPSLNSIFISMVSNLERAGDHLNYVMHILNNGEKKSG